MWYKAVLDLEEKLNLKWISNSQQVWGRKYKVGYSVSKFDELEE